MATLAGSLPPHSGRSQEYGGSVPSSLVCAILLLSALQVADFGLAEWLQHDGRIEVQLVTNRCWVAPEVLEHRFGPYTISRASEVYMFGILMYETLTGKLPYEDQLEALCLDREEARRAEVVCASLSLAAEAEL